MDCSTGSDGGVDAVVSDQKAALDQNQVPDQKATPDQKAVPDHNVSDQQVLPDQKVVVPGTWVTVSVGTFQMGSPKSELCRDNSVGTEMQNSVTLTHKFEIQATEVSQGQFKSLMGYNPAYFVACGSYCPVETVSWYQAAAYANALSTKNNLTSCYTCSGKGTTVTCKEASAYAGQKIYTCPGYRFPTEAEWEYAYRAGTKTAFYNGGITVCKYGKDSNAEKIAWYDCNSSVSYSGSDASPHFFPGRYRRA